MWLSFWVTVGFTVAFMLVELTVDAHLPAAAGYVPAVVLSIATNGWERFWKEEYYTHTVCNDAGGVQWCTEVTDYGRAPKPSGLFEVVWPWLGDQTFWGWLFRGVPLDLAAGAVAAGVVWLCFRVAGRQKVVEEHLTESD